MFFSFLLKVSTRFFLCFNVYGLFDFDVACVNFIQLIFDAFLWLINSIFTYLFFPDLETYPTFQGRRLLVASWWSKVRQPNYVGDILQNVALLPLLYFRFAWPPLLAALFTIVLLMQRARRVSDRNAKKYNSAWQRYCTKVPKLLVPKVF